MIQNRPGPRSPTNRPSRSTTARSHCCAICGDRASEQSDDDGLTTHAGDPSSEPCSPAESSDRRRKTRTETTLRSRRCSFRNRLQRTAEIGGGESVSGRVGQSARIAIARSSASRASW